MLFGWSPAHPIPLLWLFSLIALLILFLDRTFDRKRLVRIKPRRRFLAGAFLFFVPAAIILTAVLAVAKPSVLLGFPRHRPLLWLLVMILYPLLSVYPQGILYRAFIFHRYRDLFGEQWGMILASAASFSYMHIVLKNPVAIILTFAGGLLFAKTYRDSNSLPLSSLEHAMYGNLLFTIGYGHYIYTGAAG